MRIRNLLFTAIFIAFTMPALASTLYTYTGTNFTLVSPQPGANYTTSNHITGSFTLATALSPNLTFGVITPVTFTFTDGIQTLTDTTPNYYIEDFEFSTDSAGLISSWVVNLQINNVAYISTQGFPLNSTYLDQAGKKSRDTSGYGEAFTSGKWSSQSTSSGGPSVVPEPSTFALMTTGILCVGSALRRRR